MTKRKGSPRSRTLLDELESLVSLKGSRDESEEPTDEVVIEPPRRERTRVDDLEFLPDHEVTGPLEASSDREIETLVVRLRKPMWKPRSPTLKR